MNQQPFSCDDCNQQAKEKFTILHPDAVAEDWVIAYPERQLIHIHYGTPTQGKAGNIQEAKEVAQFIYATAAAHPETKFYIVVDFTTSDSTEYIPPESMTIYKKILQHPQLGHGAIYGGPMIVNELIKLIMWVAGKPISIVGTKEEAESTYQQWLHEQA